MTPRLLAAAVVIIGSVSVAASAARQPVPASLTAAESNAEDIVDAALAHDRSGLVSIAAELKASAHGQAAMLRNEGVPAALVSELGQRADRLATVARDAPYVRIMLAANAVSQLMPALFARFAGPVPPAIQALDYLDREAQFRSLAGEPGRVAAAVKELDWTWAHVRANVVAAGGRSEAAAYARHVAAMKRLDPGAGAPVQSEARRGLELVDGLERVFG
jgi:hypothetical protein